MAHDFINWLKTQTGRDDPIGDLARDIVRDPIAPKRGGYITLRRYLHGFDDILKRAKVEFDNRPPEEVQREKDEENLRKMERAWKLPALIGAATEIERVRSRRPDVLMAVIGRALDYSQDASIRMRRGEITSSQYMDLMYYMSHLVEQAVLKEKRASWWADNLDRSPDEVILTLLGKYASLFPQPAKLTPEEKAAHRQDVIKGYRNRPR